MILEICSIKSKIKNSFLILDFSKSESNIKPCVSNGPLYILSKVLTMLNILLRFLYLTIGIKKHCAAISTDEKMSIY